jgi:spectinomycin phosphotransferase
MLEKPNIEDEKIVACLNEAYGLSVAEIIFLPLGADLNTAVYRATVERQTAYFVKLRRDDFSEASVTVPKYLSDSGIKQIIPPIPTQKGQLWASLDPYKVILYPFIEGQNAFEVNLLDEQRIEFGVTLKQLHSADIPAAITQEVRREAFSPRWRETMKSFLALIESQVFTEPVAAELAAFLQAKRLETADLIKRAEHLACTLQAETPAFILCHGDIHGWNLLLDNQNHLYVVDWDTLVFAPKERDLMFVGCGLGGNGHTPEEEEILFYRGYGPTQIDVQAMAYYRFERIIEDIAISCEQIFLSEKGGEDRLWSLELLKSNYRPQSTIQIAYQLDKTGCTE